jgi:hypothetical protein
MYVFLRSLFIFAAALALFLFLFIVLERNFSPSFEACINHDRETTADSTTLGVYVHCTGTFIADNNGAITALATLVIAAFTATLWFATNRQAELTKEAFIADKRAFIFATGFNLAWEQDKATGQYNWRFRPVLRNSGGTPTKTMEMYVACEVRNAALPPGYKFTPQVHNIARAVMPPMFELQGGLAPQIPGAAITPQDILDAQQGKNLYISGDGLNIGMFSLKLRSTPHGIVG